MLLAIDVGNTNTVMGAFEGPRLEQHWRVETGHGRTADEWGILARGLLAASGLEAARVDAVAVCSVVPPLTFQTPFSSRILTPIPERTPFAASVSSEARGLTTSLSPFAMAEAINPRIV